MKGVSAVPKFKADVHVGNAHDERTAPPSTEEHSVADESETSGGETDFVTSATTIGVIGVAVALLDIALIPGMVIGVAATLAPKYVPQLGSRLQPLFNYTVRGAYKVSRKARSAVAEAQERMHDIAAEVEAEAVTESSAAEPA
jgi:hypothetical protein